MTLLGALPYVTIGVPVVALAVAFRVAYMRASGRGRKCPWWHQVLPGPARAHIHGHPCHYQSAEDIRHRDWPCPWWHHWIPRTSRSLVHLNERLNAIGKASAPRVGPSPVSPQPGGDSGRR